MKKMLLFFLLIMLTGCDITYNLELDDKFTENIIIKEHIVEGQESDELRMKLSIGEPLYHDSTSGGKYEIKKTSDDGVMTLSANGVFPFDNSHSNAIYTACGDYKLDRNGDKVRIVAGDFKLFDIYPPLDSFTVNIKSKKKILRCNADKVKGNVYTWVITKDNYSNKTINLTYLQNDYSLFDDPIFKFGLVLFIIVVIFGLVYVFIKARFLKINKL